MNELSSKLKNVNMIPEIKLNEIIWESDFNINFAYQNYTNNIYRLIIFTFI